MQKKEKIKSAFFITFRGDCKKALTLYQTCFGGHLQFDTLDKTLAGVEELPVVSGFLVSEKITIYGSDLVHNEGRRMGNHMAIFIPCASKTERLDYLKKLNHSSLHQSKKYPNQKLIEIVDSFEVRWVFGV